MRHLFFGFVFLIATGLLLQIGHERGPIERQYVDRLEPPPMSKWSPRAVRVATMGHKGLYDDLATTWILQLLTEKNLKTIASAEQLNNAVMPVLRQLPNLESIYLFTMIIFGMEYDRAEYSKDIALLGLKAFPNSWRIPMMQGFLSNFMLGRKAEAATFYGLAATRPGSPDHVRRLAQKLAESSESELDLNESIQALKEIPGGTKLLELLRPRLKDAVPAPYPAPQGLQPDPTNPSEESAP